MTPSPIDDLQAFTLPHVVKTGLRATLTAGLLLLAYFLLPVEHRAHQSVLLRLAVALALFVVVLGNEIRLISSHDRPLLRATVALATVIPLFLILFVWIYLTLARSDPASFGEPLSRISALYFTVTVFSTVGFGDIVAKTDVGACLVVTIQMLTDLAVVALVIRLIFGTAARRADRLQDPGT